MTADQLVSQYGPIVAIIVAFIASVGAAAVPLAITIANSRVKVAEARSEALAAKEAAAAAKEIAEAHMVTAMSNLTAALQTQNDGVLKTMAGAIDRMAEMLLMMNKAFAASGTALATHIDTAGVAQAASTNAAIDTALGVGSPILKAIETFTETLRLLTEQIKTSGEVDDKLRADILAQMKEINALLTRSEAKAEKAKEKVQDEKSTQTTIELSGQVTGLLNTDALGSDKPGGGSG